MLSSNTPESNLTAEELLERFSKGSSRQRRALLDSVESRVEEIADLALKFLQQFDPEGDDWAAGWLLQVFKRHQPQVLSDILSLSANGWFKSPSAVGIDYGPLQEDLLAERFEEADRFTSSVLRQLVGETAQNRGYIYYSEVNSIPEIDLTTLDRLWIAYSQGKFGFSVQGRLLASMAGRYDRLWGRIGWKQEGVWTRYPSAFNWSLDAPEGHMPLTNQLRGVRLINAILNHPAVFKRT